jgi:2-polyprenyl-3-methyl-5-hydroxy-6-metoxy-1,4-benzoquinol methylase
MLHQLLSCPLCGNEAHLVRRDITGYREDLSYDIFTCVFCEASHARPLRHEEKVYQNIYKLADRIPGYDRYFRYFSEIVSTQNPLKYLADMEGMYWAVSHFLSERKNLRVLELGCGMGYLTYALHKEGYDVTGIDLSEEAIERARKQFNKDIYICGNILDAQVLPDAVFDIIILLEVIEHLPDIPDFLSRLKIRLAPGGTILLTTPNKSIYPPGTIWQTDLPPVHLWWLSEKSFWVLADRMGFSLELTDFTPFNSGRKNRVRCRWPGQETLPKPIFDKNGILLTHEEKPKKRHGIPGCFLPQKKQLTHQDQSRCAILRSVI